ncbi:MAG TPA: ketopantoate reductase C-terminal domain-containing protein [Candidatus Binataceae bacterium]|nr:ketopantoate reductase C-terminal domain-containing protein [Candidatus Binataceae bacterium]
MKILVMVPARWALSLARLGAAGEEGKRLEYEALAGAVVRIARRHHLQLPAMEGVYARLKAAGPSGRVAPRPGRQSHSV